MEATPRTDKDARSVSDEAMQRAVGALLDGQPIPDDARARLTDEEWMELARLAATASLARIVLQDPTPTQQAEEASLRRAQDRVIPHASNAPATAAPPPPAGQPGGWLGRWWRKKGNP